MLSSFVNPVVVFTFDIFLMMKSTFDSTFQPYLTFVLQMTLHSKILTSLGKLYYFHYVFDTTITQSEYIYFLINNCIKCIVM